MTDNLSFTTVRDADLSLWQSVVERKAREKQSEGAPADHPRLLNDPHVQAATTHARLVSGDHKSVAEALKSKDTVSDREHTARISEHYLKVAQAKVQLSAAQAAPHEGLKAGLEHAVAVVRGEAEVVVQEADAAIMELLKQRRFGSLDPLFLECVTDFVSHRVDRLVEGRPQLTYRDWRQEGNSSQGYSVVAFELPNNAKVGIIGDWGTGMPDAENLLYSMMKYQSPDVILHLGDVYYSGTGQECTDNVIKVCQRVFDRVQKRVPVFSIPGNHDYYGGGDAFYDMLDAINDGEPSWRQAASYFCLRSQDGRWQFLGMDTGHDDANPIPGEHNEAPTLQESEVEWLVDKMTTFPGSTVLLSHHPLFSQSSLGGGSEHPYLNGFLLDTFRPHLPQVAGWFWGHEHSLVVYEDQINAMGGATVKGRLVGNSAYEMEVSTAKPKYAAEVPSKLIALGQTENFYNHSYTVLELTPAGTISADYYETSSGSRPAMSAAPPSVLFHEDLHGRSDA